MFDFLQDYIDMDIFYSPAFWLLTGGTMIAFILGFRAEGLWSTVGVENATAASKIGKVVTKAIILLLTPVIGYIITWKFSQ